MAKRDYYDVLGVNKSSSADQIKSAYRKLAVKYHPDKNPGDSKAEEKFKEASEAYGILSDKEKKQNYDNFGHAAFENGGGRPGGGFGGFSGADFSDIFEDFFGDFGGGGSSRRSWAVFVTISRWTSTRSSSRARRRSFNSKHTKKGCTKW